MDKITKLALDKINSLRSTGNYGTTDACSELYRQTLEDVAKRVDEVKEAAQRCSADSDDSIVSVLHALHRLEESWIQLDIYEDLM